MHRLTFAFGLSLGLCLLAGVAGAAPAAAPAPESLPRDLTVKICEDDAEWPPFTYFERAGGKPTPHLVGVAVEAIDRILTRAGVRYTIDMLPWTRCQEGIRSGSYHMALNASYSEARARDYWLSRPLYHLNSHYYYSRRQHPQGLAIQSIDDLKRYRVCGLLGYNYSTYGLQPDDLDLSPANFALVINKVEHGRCDLFVEKREIIAGFGVIDPRMAQALANPDLASAPVPGVPPTPFHMMVTRARPWGQSLVQLLDRGIVELDSRGEMRQILGRYVH